MLFLVFLGFLSVCRRCLLLFDVLFGCTLHDVCVHDIDACHRDSMFFWTVFLFS